MNETKQRSDWSPLNVWGSFKAWFLWGCVFWWLYVPLWAMTSLGKNTALASTMTVLFAAGASIIFVAPIVILLRRGTRAADRHVHRLEEKREAQANGFGVNFYPPESADALAFMTLWHETIAPTLGKPFHWQEARGHSLGTLVGGAAMNFAASSRRGGNAARFGARTAANTVNGMADRPVDMFLDPLFIVDNGNGLDVWFPNQNIDTKTLHAVSARVAELLNVESVELRSDPGTAGGVNGWKIMYESATSKKFSLATPYPPMDDKGYLQIGVKTDGSPQMLKVANNSGWVIGGQPGSGKSGVLFSVIGSLAQQSNVSFAILDGKGGDDFTGMKSRCFAFTDASSLQRAARFFRLLHHEMDWRAQGGVSRTLGASNIWNAGATPEMPLLFVVVDECQEIYAENSSDSKEVKNLKAEIRGMAINLVKKGRSTGIILVSSTQRISSSSIPTNLSSECGVRLGFRTADALASSLILGEKPAYQPDGDVPHLLRSEDVGVGFLSDGVNWSKFRVPWLDPESPEYKQLIAETSRYVNMQTPIHLPDIEWAMNTPVNEAKTGDAELDLNIAGYQAATPAVEPESAPVIPPAAQTPAIPPAAPITQTPTPTPAPTQAPMTEEELWRLEQGL